MADDTEAFVSFRHRQRPMEVPAVGSAPRIADLAVTDLFVGSVAWAVWKALSAGSSASNALDSVGQHLISTDFDSTVVAVDSERLPVRLVSDIFAGFVDGLARIRHLKFER